MNYCIFLGKIIVKPQPSLFENDISLVEATIQFPNRWEKKSFDQLRIAVWGNLGKDLLKYYKVGDYILLEGSLSLRKSISFVNDIEPELTVMKLYPFILIE
jgi:single-stranded DNA-binding protein